MALEPLLPSDIEHDTAVRRRFCFAVGLELPVRSEQTQRSVESALSSPVVLRGAANSCRRGSLGIVQRTPNTYTFTALEVIVAFAYGVPATFAPSKFSATMRDVHGTVGGYFEAFAVIVVLVLLGKRFGRSEYQWAWEAGIASARSADGRQQHGRRVMDWTQERCTCLSRLSAPVRAERGLSGHFTMSLTASRSASL
jgi:hypothetical protein